MSYGPSGSRRTSLFPSLPRLPGVERALGVLPTPARVVRSVPDVVHTRVLCRIGNHLIRSQGVADRLLPVDGRRICVAASSNSGSRVSTKST